MNWVAVSVRTGGEARAAVVEALFAAGSRAVEEVGDDLRTYLLRTYLPAGTDLGSLVRAVATASPSARVETEEVVLPDWDTAWRRHVTVQRAGPLTIAPPWLAGDLDASTTVIIEPGMAFGTGDHATTRGVLRLMAPLLRAGDRVADLGAGSGVLAIAAAKLGASNVAAIEVDPDAIDNAESNVRANGVADRVSVLLGDASTLLPLVAPVRVVVANIVPPVLLSLLPVIERSLTRDGCAILGGITQDERPAFVRELGDAGWKVAAEHHEDGWWSAAVVRR